MQIFRELAGYTLGRADIVRRAMGKKKIDVMNKEREVFVEGAAKNGIDEVSANKIFDEMAGFAKYAFNSSASAVEMTICSLALQRSAIFTSKALIVSHTTSASAGLPGPFDTKIPSGLNAKISSAGVLNGTITTLHPRLLSIRTKFNFAPQSIKTTSKR